MDIYIVKHRGGLLFVGTSNPGSGICDKSLRVGLYLGSNDLGLDCSKSYETRRQENSLRCRWRNPVVSMLVWPSDGVEIKVKPSMMCSMCFPSDPAWIMIKPGFY